MSRSNYERNEPSGENNTGMFGSLFNGVIGLFKNLFFGSEEITHKEPPPRPSISHSTVYYDQEEIDVSKLISNPIRFMNICRLENAGVFQVPNSFFDPTAKKLNNFNFPSEFNYLLGMKKLDETNLKPKQKLWSILIRKPTTKNEIINKEIALICLNWAQSQLDQQVSLFSNAKLSQVDKRVFVNKRGVSAKVMLVLTFDEKAKRAVKPGTYLTFTSTRNKGELDIPSCRVTSIRDTSIDLMVCVRNIHKDSEAAKYKTLLALNNESVFAFEHQPDFVPQSMLRSIERIKEGALDHVILPTPKFQTNEQRVKSSFNQLFPTLKYVYELNEHQAKALFSICTSTHGSNPYVLHGPPGTGKTRLIAITVRCLLQMDPKVRILLTAPSNSAADMIALKIMDEFDTQTMNASNVLRLKSTGNDYFGRDKTLDSIVKFDKELGMYEIPSISELQQYRVVISTLGCSSHIINQGVPPGFFTHIFLDEAGQASESDIWIPLGGLATRNTSVILCGDPKQLGPVYTLDLKPEVTKNFDSPLVRYMEMDVYKKDSRLFCQLERSYRCHQSILSIASELFYQSKLLTAIIQRHEPFVNWSALPKKNFPVLFVNVKGSEFFENGTSPANKEEIEVVMEYFKRIKADFNMDSAEIGIISPYTHQTRLIRQHIKGMGDISKITVDSVERFQGSERDVIITTTTRTKRLGFLECNLRLNTLITRAKHLLIIVGNKDMLVKSRSWKSFIQYCDSNNSVIDWNGTVQTFKNK